MTFSQFSVWRHCAKLTEDDFIVLRLKSSILWTYMWLGLSIEPLVAGVFGIILLIFFFLRMRVQRFYFIRHGETLLNASHIRQGADGALSPKGREQAKTAGEALKGLGIRRIFSSTYPRAKETARIIAEAIRAPILYSSLLIERRNPTEIIGKDTKDPEVMHIVDQVDLAYHDDDYRFSDEENFTDLKLRGEKCLDLLARQGSHTNAVVTHHIILKMLVACALYRERLTAADFTKLTFFNFSDNAGITIFEYHPWRRFLNTRGWQVIGYNQHPHI